MDSSHQINVPLRSGCKKIRKRRELDALIAHSFGKKQSTRGNNLNRTSQDKLLSASTDEAEEYTWIQMNKPKNCSSTNRCHNRKYMICKPLLLLIASLILLGLLYWMYLDLRQEIYDYRHKIEEVAVMSQNLPDTLQKWHESSTWLEKNQTASIVRLNELEYAMERLRINFTKFKTSSGTQKSFGKEEKLVANFGAQIESMATDVDSIKEHYMGVLNKQTKMQTDLSDLNIKLSETQEKITKFIEIPQNISKEVLFMISYMKNYSIMSHDLNQTSIRERSILQKGIERNQNQISDLLNRIGNVTLHLASIENSWEEYKSDIKDCQGLIQSIANDVTDLKLQSRSMNQSILNICTTCNKNGGTFKDPPKTSDNYTKNAISPVAKIEEH